MAATRLIPHCCAQITVRGREDRRSSLWHPQCSVPVTGIQPQSLPVTTLAPRATAAPIRKHFYACGYPWITPRLSPTARASFAWTDLTSPLTSAFLRTPRWTHLNSPRSIRYASSVLKRRGHLAPIRTPSPPPAVPTHR